MIFKIRFSKLNFQNSQNFEDEIAVFIFIFKNFKILKFQNFVILMIVLNVTNVLICQMFFNKLLRQSSFALRQKGELPQRHPKHTAGEAGVSLPRLVPKIVA